MWHRQSMFCMRWAPISVGGLTSRSFLSCQAPVSVQLVSHGWICSRQTLTALSSASEKGLLLCSALADGPYQYQQVPRCATDLNSPTPDMHWVRHSPLPQCSLLSAATPAAASERSRDNDNSTNKTTNTKQLCSNNNKIANNNTGATTTRTLTTNTHPCLPVMSRLYTQVGWLAGGLHAVLCQGCLAFTTPPPSTAKTNQPQNNKHNRTTPSFSRPTLHLHCLPLPWMLPRPCRHTCRPP